MSANYEKCVPGNNEELLYWLILNLYSEIWRTRKKTISALVDEHLTRSTQQAEQSWLNTRAGSEACQSIFLKLTKDDK
jgi:hypothetical protein